MRGARARIDIQIEMSNRQAWNTAALTGGAMAGKLPAYEKIFGGLRAGATQTPEVQQTMCDTLAKNWGAVMEA